MISAPKKVTDATGPTITSRVKIVKTKEPAITAPPIGSVFLGLYVPIGKPGDWTP